MLINKMNGFIFFLGFILFSCKTDPLLINPIGSDSLLRNFFSINSYSNSEQDSISTGNSQRLYSGIINGESSYSLIKLDLNNFVGSHPVCDTIISCEEPSITLKSITDISASGSGSDYEFNILKNEHLYLHNYWGFAL